ncbi:NERD domain-containing protein [Bacillus sp. DNRA2]|uniref:nuclease-related domain-containing protein n=1 Tax=Bacillus sp. DNRA2 TaxID=2723053 RepID=UPI00145DD72E|nr:nuclease-related domain-containing protein [Bacillus sp. DNRA2]NMD68925.1 NERD domain-containing protein [Bacillus sp. DNRA2]
MIIGKQRQVPRKLLFCQAARARLAVNHPLIPIIEEDIRRCEAGFAGEERLDRLLAAKYHDQNSHLIQGLQLPFCKDSNFQIDTLLLKPTHIVPIEVKNMTGELFIDRQIGQMIQSIGDKRFVYEDPLTQVHIQAQHLYQWILRHGFPSIMVEPLVMMSNSNCILRIENNDAEAQSRICRGRKVLFRIDDFDNKHRTNILTPNQLHEISRLIVQEDMEQWYDFEKIYKTPRSHLHPGVQCSNCRCLGMKYYQGWWICLRCRHKSSDAHLAALRDYYLLWGPEITNAMFRWFLGIDSIHVASKLLKKLNLPYKGQNKYRVYTLPFEIF